MTEESIEKQNDPYEDFYKNFGGGEIRKEEDFANIPEIVTTAMIENYNHLGLDVSEFIKEKDVYVVDYVDGHERSFIFIGKKDKDDMYIHIFDLDSDNKIIGKGVIKIDEDKSVLPKVGWMESFTKKGGLGVRRLYLMNAISVLFTGNNLDGGNFLNEDPVRIWEYLVAEGVAVETTEKTLGSLTIDDVDRKFKFLPREKWTSPYHDQSAFED